MRHACIRYTCSYRHQIVLLLRKPEDTGFIPFVPAECSARRRKGAAMFAGSFGCSIANNRVGGGLDERFRRHYFLNLVGAVPPYGLPCAKLKVKGSAVADDI